MKIAIACDHGGYQLKEEVKAYLLEREIEVLDLGTNSEASVDYPEYGFKCGEAVANGDADRGTHAHTHTHTHTHTQDCLTSITRGKGKNREIGG